jgi:hypothetical protein
MRTINLEVKMEAVDDIVGRIQKQRNHMKNKGDSWIEYSNYEKHYIEDTKRGHKITLLSKDGSKLENQLCLA